MIKYRKVMVAFVGIIGCLAIIMTGVSTNNRAYARVDAQRSNVVTQKALLQGLVYCYITGGINDTVDSISLFNNFSEQQVKDSNPYNNENYVALPSGLTLIQDNGVSCRQLFGGYNDVEWNSFEGVFSFFGKKGKSFSSNDDNAEKAAFLEGMGFKMQESSGNCVTYIYETTWVNYGTNSSKGSAEVYTKNVCTKGETFELQDYDVNSKDVPIDFTLSSDKKKITKLHTNYKNGGGIFSDGAIDVDVDISANASDWQTQLSTAISANFQKFISETGDPLDGQYSFSRTKINGEGDKYYKIPNASSRRSDKFSEAADKAINYLSGGKYKNRAGIRFSEAEQLSYYIQAIKEWFYDGAENSGDSEYWACGKDWSMYGSFTLEIKRSSSGTVASCRIDPDKAKKKNDDHDNGKLSNNSNQIYGFNSTVYEVDGEKYLAFDSSGNTQLTLEEVVAKINELSDDVSDSDMPGATTSDDENGEVELTCANSGGAASLGWIVCPILEWLGKAADDTYSNYVEPSLEIEAQLFSDNKEEGTLNAWETFRNIANIGFIILVLVVIFSQLTGVGIDNYGIKKILPKLILVAILVNLSYLICLICVDISNILGNAFKSLFDGLSTGTPKLNISDSNLIGKEVGATTLTGVAVLGALVLMVGAVWKNPAILLSLLVSALGVVIAIFFLFILLSARQAAIIVLTVISPLAFICYILPNTKKFFDKWLKFGEGLLLVYPICGLLVGGGDYISRLLLSAGFTQGGFVSAFTAMIVGVLPIFFIPTVLKGAFAAMGNIGAAITGVGKNLQGRATRGIRNAEGYKTAQKRGLERRARIKAGYNEKTGELTRSGRIKARFANTRFGRGIGYGKSQAGYIESAKKIAGENESASASLVTALSSADIAKRGGDVKGYYNDMLVKAGNTGNVSNVNAAITAAVNSGQIKEKDIADMLRNALNDGNIKISNDGTMSNMLREMAAKHGSGFLSTDAELKSFMQKGGVDSGRKLALGDYGDYARAGNMDATDIKKEDVNKLSGDSLSGLIRSGVLDQGMAQQMLAMNPNISNDKRIMLGAAANNLGEGMSVEDFKEAAKSIANNPADAGLISGMTETMAKALTSATPQSVNVVQNFQGGGRQINPVDVSLRSNHREPDTHDADTSTWD